MARLLDDASSQYLTNANAIVSATPLTMACWFYSDDATVLQTLMSIGQSADNTNFFSLHADGSVAGDPVRISRNGSVVASTTTGYTVNTWHHACAVYADATTRASYIDGGSKGTDSTSWTPSGMNVTSIGRLERNSTTKRYMSGRVAWPAIWNVALTDAEVLMLARGFSPHMVRPEALVAFWPLHGNDSPEPDLFGGFALTLSGSPTKAESVRLFVPSGGRLYVPAGGASPQTLSPESIASAEAFGTPVVTPGEVSLAPESIASAEAFGSPVVTPGAVTLSPSSIETAEAFGTPTVSPGAVTVSPESIGSAEAFGTPVVTPGAVSLAPSSIASAEAFGTPVVTLGEVSTDFVYLTSGRAADVLESGRLEPSLVSGRRAETLTGERLT